MRKSIIRIVLLLAVSALIALPVYGWETSTEDADQPPCAKQQKMHKMKGHHLDQMMEALDLSAEQQDLFEDSKAAHQAHFEQMRESVGKPSRENFQQMHESMRAMHEAFAEAMELDNPDFAAAGEIAKQAYLGPNADGFSDLIDSKVNFLQSLTAEQREKLAEMMADAPRHGGPPPLDR